MLFKWFLVLVAIIESSVAAIISTGQCRQKKGAKISFTKLNGKQWHEVYESDIPPGQKCMFEVFQTSRDGSPTAITRTYTNTSSDEEITTQGSLQFNSSFGNFTVNMPGYPADGKYWLLDFTPRAATAYMCLQLDNDQIYETAWIVVSNLRFARNRLVLSRSKRILEQNGFCSAKLVKVNTNC